MSFKWKNGDLTHACRRTLIYCVTAYKDDISRMKDTLKSWSYHDCTEEEIVEYLKLYPITKDEIRRDKALTKESKKFFAKLMRQK